MNIITGFSLFLTFSMICLTSGEICQDAVCEYEFVLTYEKTMTYREGKSVYSVNLNGSQLQVAPDLFRPEGTSHTLGKFLNANQVITADGFPRTIITINGQFPGPTIEVMEGTQVAVKVTNALVTDGVTIHWHGIYQRGTPWQDGTAYLTQCPIAPRQSFIYRFIAEPSGTHMYHSHFWGQRIDGLFGALIVHKFKPDIPYFVISVTDWHHLESHSLEASNPYSAIKRGTGDAYRYILDKGYSADGIGVADLVFVSALINGRGRWNNKSFPLSIFKVTSGEKYLMRVNNNGYEYAMRLSIDSHNITIVALDGNDIKPITIDSVIIAVGESVDFHFTANQGPSVKLFWMRCQTLRVGTGGNRLNIMPEPVSDGVVQDVKAIIAYDNVNIEDPQSVHQECTESRPCLVFNCPFAVFPASENMTCISLETAKSTNSTDILSNAYGLTDTPDIEHIFNINFAWGTSINGIKYGPSTQPASDGETFTNSLMSCNTDDCRSTDKGCVCTQTVDLPYNKVVQIVISNLEPTLPPDFAYLSHHPIHIHGHYFAVVKVGYPNYNLTSGQMTSSNPDIECINRLCKNPKWKDGVHPTFNLINPPIKNTVVVSAGGYVVLRMRTDNPGPWLLHCHATTHRTEGMAILLEEAKDKYPKVPHKFPTCKSFVWSQQDFEKHLKDEEETTNEGSRIFNLSTTQLVGYILAAFTIGVLITVSILLLYFSKRKEC